MSPLRSAFEHSDVRLRPASKDVKGVCDTTFPRASNNVKFDNRSHTAFPPFQPPHAATPPPPSATAPSLPPHAQTTSAQPPVYVAPPMHTSDAAYIGSGLDPASNAEEHSARNKAQKRELLGVLDDMYNGPRKREEAGFTIHSTIADLRYEVNRRQNSLNENDQVTFWQNGMKFAFAGLEGLNNKVGPILKIKGWSNEMLSDMDQFNRPLRTIYRRHFQRKQANPFFQIGLTILFSLIVFHFREYGTSVVSSFTGKETNDGTKGGQHAKPGADDIEPPPDEHAARDYNRPGGTGPNIGTLGSIFKMFTNQNGK